MPIERRKIIDDVAGISTFDEDIKKAEKERADVERNLERIKIILNEITSQTRQLKKDRDSAYRYKELKDVLNIDMINRNEEIVKLEIVVNN